MRPRSALAFLLPVLGTLVLLPFLAPPSRSADKPTPAELKEKIKVLVEQLAAKEADKQDEAALELIKLGPDALPYLPKAKAKLTQPQKDALAVIRKKLRDQQIQRDLAPKLVTIEDEQPVSKMLAELEKQTGIAVEDRREGTDSKIKLKLKNVTFWQALDAIAREADATVGYRKGIGLERRPEGYVTPPIAYDGIFRATVRRITAQRLLESENSNYVADVEVAWEPRFRPFRLEFSAGDFDIQDDKNRKIAAPEQRGDEPRKDMRDVASKHFVLFDVPLGSVDRSSAKLGQLKLPLRMIGPTRYDTFTFDKTLAELKKNPKAGELIQDGVTVRVHGLDLAKDHWTIVMYVEYPADGPQFESFESSWLLRNEILLKNKNDGSTFPENSGYNVDSSGNRGRAEYNFVDSKKDKLIRGDPDNWTVTYKVPGLIVEVPATFTFKDVPLP
jgi:hypothetical protein